jgi:hypothetical protein
MELVIEQDGISLTISSEEELDLTYLQDFLASLYGEEEEEFELDEDGTAWWFDEDEEVWYYFDEDEDDWVAYE